VEIERLASRLPVVEQESERARSAGQDLERRSAALVAEQAEVAARVDAVTSAIATRRTRLDRARGEDPSIRARADRLTATADAADALIDAELSVHRCRSELAEAEAGLADGVRTAGFDSADDATVALRDPATVGRLELAVDTFGVKEQSARQVLADPELAEVGSTPVELEPAQAVLVTATGVARDAAATATTTEHAAAALERLTAELTVAVEETAPVRDQHQRLAALADLVEGRGQNAKRMTLRSFVLAARLEEVAAAASARLDRMSAGRYSLVHTDAVGPRGTRGGLGLDVVDAYTGQVRSARTLSGGETFLASLALALGLADVVSAEAGAAPLDTLFVDEGFGSLDGDTLDAVMGVLDELRAGGRMVGLVSHVDELRTRIGHRLRVRRGRGGSRLEIEV
jgi:exonuclease SbcC